MGPVTRLIEFLRARLDEDEEIARRFERGGPWRVDGNKIYGPPRWSGADVLVVGHTWGEVEHIARHDPARVLREVAAKRALVDFLDPQGAPDGEGRYVAERALLLLALPYSGHSEYREEWKP
jgi:hypothetical protein